MYFDTHAHYDDEAFDGDRESLLESLPGHGIDMVLNPGCNLKASETAVAFAGRYPHVWAAVGWHPQDADSFDDTSEERIRAWAKQPKVKAIGEIGLDFYYETPPRDIQKKVFLRQMELACELKLPVIIHDREAHAECMKVARSFPGVRGVFHCYSGSAEMAREIVALGWYLSFTGVVTFPNARRALEAIDACPADRIMLETDAPYLAPVPMRGKRNDSRTLPLIARAIAGRKGMGTEAFAKIAAENGKRFFGIQ